MAYNAIKQSGIGCPGFYVHITFNNTIPVAVQFLLLSV